MKIYTRTGDEGETGRLVGPRVPKTHPQIEATGAVDELNAALGWAATQPLEDRLLAILNRCQNELFSFGAFLAGGAEVDDKAAVERLERDIDLLEEDLPPLRQFILPGGSPGAAALHLTRTICRRAERRVVALAEIDATRRPAIGYVNRLADLLFVMARSACQSAGAAEIKWSSDGARNT